MADETQPVVAQVDAARTNPLQSERGTTRIDDQVVAKVAGIAAQEVDGVRMGGGAASRAIGGMVEKVTGPSVTQGVSVEVGQVEAAVDLTMAILYGKSIPQVVDAIRSNVIRRIETLVGLRVTEVNIVIGDVYFEGEGAWSGAQTGPAEETVRAVR
jgi:uncharacterized alkaline shock family protein YloU